MSKIRDFLYNVTKPKNQTSYIGAESFATRNPYILDCYATDKYASIYPSIKAISNEFMKITPYAIDKNGKPQDVTPPAVINALYHPNQLDSSVAFREKLAVMNLTHRMTYVLVWRREGNEARPGGEINANNIAGFTFLENPSISIVDNKTYFSIGSQQFTDNEVISIPGGVDPSGLYQGYAPGIASASWATLDEYMASFQKGFFENGAIPAGEFRIVAATPQDFKDTKDALQAAHRGAGNNNNIIYTPVPIDPASGKPSQAKVEWIPMQQANKDIDFKNIFEQANKRMDSTFGVPASIRGVGESNNYATARVDQQNFIRFTIEPLALRIYTQITHELNRITGGLACAITFTLDYPAVAEEEKAQAETKKINVETILQLTDKGFSLDSIVDALELSNAYKILKVGGVNTKIDNDKPDVDEGGEVKTAPNPDEIDGVTPLNKVAAKRKNPKVISKVSLSDEDKLEIATRDYMKSQVDRAVAEYLADNEDAQASITAEVQPDPTDEELDVYIAAMYTVILSILIEYGAEGYSDGLGIAAINADDLQGFTLPETAEDSYRAYLRRVGASYGRDTAASIRKVLSDSETLGYTRTETKNALKNIMDADDWRVKRLARTELNNSQNIGKLEGLKSLAAEVGGNWEKTINHSGKSICPLCQSQEGIWHAIAQPLWAEGSSIIAPNDKGEEVIYINDWQSNEANDYHPNGTGTLIFRRVL